MKEIFLQPIIAIFSAVRLLFKSRKALGVILVAYAGLLCAGYLFVSTREATIAQLVLTMVLAVVAPALFFILQAASVSYTSGLPARGFVRHCFRLFVVTVPVIAVAVLGVYGLSKVSSHLTIVTALRYLLIGVVAPLLAIQLWIAKSLTNLRKLTAKAFTPQSVFVYACGFLIFAVAPYLLIVKAIPAEEAWLEFSLLMLRLSASALLVLLGWVMTVGALSILSSSPQNGTK